MVKKVLVMCGSFVIVVLVIVIVVVSSLKGYTHEKKDEDTLVLTLNQLELKYEQLFALIRLLTARLDLQEKVKTNPSAKISDSDFQSENPRCSDAIIKLSNKPNIHLTGVTKMMSAEYVTHTETKVDLVHGNANLGYLQVIRSSSAYSIYKSVHDFDLVTLNILDPLMASKTGVYTAASKPSLYAFCLNSLKDVRINFCQRLVSKFNDVTNIGSLPHAVLYYVSDDPTLLLPFFLHLLVSLDSDDKNSLHIEKEYTSMSSFGDGDGKLRDGVEFNQDVEL